MGANQSISSREGFHPGLADAILAKALLEALEESCQEDGEKLQLMREHAWDPGDCSRNFVVLRDGLTARRKPSILTSDCIRGRKCYIGGRHVFEIQWENEERGLFGILGVATPKAPLSTSGYNPVVGTNAESWGWDIVNKKRLHGGKVDSYPAVLAQLGFQVPDTFYMILDMDDGTLSFATSDIHLGVAFSSLPKQNRERPMCPIVNAIYGNCDIRIKYMGDGEKMLSGLRHPFPQLGRSVSEVHTKPTPKPDLPRSRSTGSLGIDAETVIVAPSSRYKFSYDRGGNVSVMAGGKRAKRNNALQVFNNGIVMSSEPLANNELFEVRLDSAVPRWVGSLVIGATTRDPNSFSFPSSLSEYNKDMFMWIGKKIIYGKSLEKEVKHKIGAITTGDRVGIMRKSDDTLHFYLNGSDVGKCFGRTDKTLYAVVDIYGHAEEITLTGGEAETQSSNDTAQDSKPTMVTVIVQMKNAIELLKLPLSPGLPVIIEKLYKDVLQPYNQNTNQSVRQKLGDHLADTGAALQLGKLLQRLNDTGIETQIGWAGINVVRGILWNYSDASLRMAKAIGHCGLLRIFVNDLRNVGPTAIKNEKKAYLVSSAVNSLHNCAKATENRQVFRDIKAVDVLVPLLKSETIDTVISALLTLAYITDDTQKYLLETDSKTISVLCGMLSMACGSPNLRGSNGDATWSALELVTGIANIAINQANCKMILEANVIPSLFDVLERGGPIEKESACNALWVISNSVQGKSKILGHPNAVDRLKALYKNSNKNIASSAERVLLRITQPFVQQGASAASAPRNNCEYMKDCGEFLKTLGINAAFFEQRYNKCYCTKCHASRNEKLFYTQGEPAKDYALPIGWSRFALRMNAAAISLSANSKWHVAYHGTSPSCVKPTLESGGLCIPGDTILGGKKLCEVDGHFNDERKPDGFNTKQIFVSPSIRYSAKDVYAKPTKFTHSGTAYIAKTVFQLWIKPDSYNVDRQTIGATEEIDPKFSNQEIEWSTVQRGSIHLFGVLVQLEEDKSN